MYFPTQWVTWTNSVFPEALQIVEGETQGGSNVTTRSRALKRGCVSRVPTPVCVALTTGFWRSLFKRTENETTSYTTSAILCSDGKDSGHITMTDIFDTEIISASQNVSHMCTFTLQSVQAKLGLRLYV